jgi:hypothetical protein
VYKVGAENKTALNNICAELQRSERDEDALHLTRKNNSGDQTWGLHNEPPTKRQISGTASTVVAGADFYG